jgi:RecA-family ATPase
VEFYDELLDGDEILDLPQLEPLIDGVLDLNSTAILFGPSGKGKSIIALDWALSVALGLAWDGCDVHQGPVLYVVGEGLHGTQDRFSAWCRHHKIEDTSRFGGVLKWGPRAPNLLNAVDREGLCQAAEKHQPVLTILDTVARHIPGGDENAFETISRVVEVMDHIKALTGGCVLGVHHSGKDESAGARGHSSLKGAMDTEIFCTLGPTLTATKQKNHKDGHVIGSYKLTANGSSIIAVPTKKRTNRNDEIILSALGGFDTPVRHSELRTASLALGMKAGSFDRTLTRLVETMVVTDGNDGSGYHLAQP